MRIRYTIENASVVQKSNALVIFFHLIPKNVTKNNKAIELLIFLGIGKLLIASALFVRHCFNAFNEFYILKKNEIDSRFVVSW